MGAFARAGRVSINVNYNYVTGLFRKEWGCDTISFTTDMYVGMKNCTPLDMLVRAGTDTIATSEMSGTWDADKKAVVLADGTVSAAAVVHHPSVRDDFPLDACEHGDEQQRC